MYLINILVSIIIPTYNRAYILDKAIQSVLKQTYTNWELIIIDDGSSDNTKQLIKGYQNPKIRYFYKENAGPSAARNMALSLAKGEWFIYIDSDNELYINYLEVMLHEIKQHADILYAFPKGRKTQELYQNNTLIQSIDASDIYANKVEIKDIFMREFIFDINGFMHARQIVEEGYLFDEKLELMEDWDLLMSISTKFPLNFLYVPHELFHYHQRFGTDGLVSKASYALLANTYTYLYDKHKKSSFMKGQKWYPSKVKKYQKLQKDFLKGEAPESYLRYFS